MKNIKSTSEDLKMNLDADINDLFISFTNIEKLGINPLYGYNTPMGIYFFPLAEIWEHYNISK